MRGNKPITTATRRGVACNAHAAPNALQRNAAYCTNIVAKWATDVAKRATDVANMANITAKRADTQVCPYIIGTDTTITKPAIWATVFVIIHNSIVETDNYPYLRNNNLTIGGYL